jgi:diaminohydroxyphosphoribosylaminopyrimidine deaminase/5-amino-6-(5-phosphoribosylamino)uracil reductase
MTDAELPWMTRALSLAEGGRGFVEPNPLVGAVVVQDGRVVGEGWHQRYGGPHAEIHALAAAGAAARGATLYVTLEPCCHYGKTPPCTYAISQSGIRRVVAAMMDPFPEVSGKGLGQLRSSGLVVEAGLGEAEARRLNAPYLKLLASGRPYVHAKWAMTLDGKIAARTGDAKWITGDAARARVHELRGRMDGILVGIGTVLADDPLLTARPPGPRTPLRIVLDSHARLSPGSALARTAGETPVLVATGGDVAPERAARLRDQGCEVLSFPTEGETVSLPNLLAELGRRRLTNLLVEGGAGVLGSFWDGREIDEVHAFISPRLLGGAAAKSPIGGHGDETVAASWGLRDCRIERLGEDFLIHGRLGGAPTAPDGQHRDR